MNFRKYKTAVLIIGAIIINGCSKQDLDPLLDNRPDFPVSITNATLQTLQSSGPIPLFPLR